MVSAPPEPEAGFVRAVIQLARLLGWKAYHQRPARTARGWRTALQGDRGFLDLVLCKPPRLIVAECKSAGGRVPAEQREWMQALSGCPRVEVYIWRPADWPIIEEILRGEGWP